VGRAISAIQESFGNPHQHSGLGIRRLRENIFEGRLDLKLRLVFEAQRGLLSFTGMKSHDDLQKMLKNR